MTDDGSGVGGGWPSSKRARLLTVVLLTAVAAVPRFYHLGDLSLAWDEDLTALAAQSVVNGDLIPSLPSGMPYWRALPFTWANALAVEILGEDEERSYRAVAAAFGSATPAALYLCTSAVVSPPVALVAATMLAVSSLHIGHSRAARMYAPFLFFFVLTAHFMWRWARNGGGRNLILALSLLGVTTSLHLLGVLAVQFALIPLALMRTRGPPALLVIVLALGAAGVMYVLDDLLVERPYLAWSLPPELDLGGSAPAPAALAAVAAGLGMIGMMAIATGLVGGTIAGWKDLRRAETDAKQGDLARRAAVLCGWTSMGGFLGAGHLWAAAQAALVLLLIHPRPGRHVLRDNWSALAGLACLGLAWTTFAVSSLGVSDGIRRLVLFPFPNLYFFGERFPGIMLLFGCAALWMAFTADRSERPGVVGAIIAVILTTAALGAVREWTPVRYMLGAYPYVLVAAATVLVAVSRGLVGRFAPTERARTVGVAIALLTVLVGVTGGHGVRAAAREASAQHGYYPGSFSFHPDHRGPGEFVRNSLEPNDIVITEHPDTQIIYAGQVDYWFRRLGDARAVLYEASDGSIRERYANALPLTTVSSLREVVDAAGGRVWLIVSGETFPQKDLYLSTEQLDWLDSVEGGLAPVFVGKDGVSKVFCLNCDG